MFKKVVVGLLCIMLAFPLVGCKTKDEFALNSVGVQIKQEFQQQFEEEIFTIEDFQWDNVESVLYVAWFDSAPEPYGYAVIYLKEHGKKQVLDAIEHFKTLDFVKGSDVEAYYYPF